MNLIQFLIVAGMAGGGYHYWKQHQSSAAEIAAQVQSGPLVSGNGFVALPPANGHTRGKVFVVAALHCSKDEALRADSLAEELSRKGIPVERASRTSFTFASPPDSAVMQRMEILNGPFPVVFVNGRAKSNPSFEEVVAELRGSRT